MENDSNEEWSQPLRTMIIGSGKLMTSENGWETFNLHCLYFLIAGSGKSTVINTLVTAVRRMFGYKNVIQIFAPTGGAAANAGGRTIHSGLKVAVDKKFKKRVEEVPLIGKKRNFSCDNYNIPLS